MRHVKIEDDRPDAFPLNVYRVEDDRLAEDGYLFKFGHIFGPDGYVALLSRDEAVALIEGLQDLMRGPLTWSEWMRTPEARRIAYAERQAEESQ